MISSPLIFLIPLQIPTPSNPVLSSACVVWVVWVNDLINTMEYYEIEQSLNHESAYLLQNLAPERNVRQGVEKVRDHLPDQRQKHQES